MGHQQDFWESLRAVVLPRLGWLLQQVQSHVGGDLYAETTTGRSQFACVVHKTEEKLERDLHAIGFERNPLAAWKTLVGTDRTEEGSWRYYGTDNESIVAPTDSFEQFINEHGTENADTQLHVILYELDDRPETTAVFAHHEAAWHTHPIVHYNAVYYDPILGVNATRHLFREYYGDAYDGLVEEHEDVLPG
jgi:hypothetical protein